MELNKVFIITGSTRGIGKYLAKYYLKNNIVVGCGRGKSQIEHSNYYHFELNVSDELAVKKLFLFVRKKFGRLDVLINNAGIASMNHSVLTPIPTVKNILETNVVGTFLFSRESFKLMKNRKKGRIINFSTFAVPFKLEGEAIYAASKAAVTSLTETLCREYSEYNITVNTIAPPAVKTDLIKGVPTEKIEKLIDRQAIHRFGELDDISNVINFFIDDKSDMITGQILYLGGV